MKEQIDARELIKDVLPKLKATRHLIDNTLKARIEQSEDDEQRRRLILLQQEFELEMTMIKLNMDHLLTRYHDQLKAAAEGHGRFTTPILALDQSEAVAIESARNLYRRAYELQVR